MGAENYIGLDRTTPSRSGLYAVDLPGVSLSLIQELTSDEEADYLEVWDKIYNRAWLNLSSDVQEALQDKFLVNEKLASRETSQFLDELNEEYEDAGIELEFDLPRYARIHIISIEVFSEAAYQSPGFQFTIRNKDADGEELYAGTASLDQGRTVIPVDKDFQVCELFISYDAGLYDLKKTENKYFRSHGYHWDKLACTFPCCGDGRNGRATQVNGGGLNVKFDVVCSVEAFISDNINLFARAFLYKLGVEIMAERTYTEVVSRYSSMTTETIERNTSYFATEYSKRLKNVVNGLRIPESERCFVCADPIIYQTMTP